MSIGQTGFVLIVDLGGLLMSAIWCLNAQFTTDLGAECSSFHTSD